MKKNGSTVGPDPFLDTFKATLEEKHNRCNTYKKTYTTRNWVMRIEKYNL